MTPACLNPPTGQEMHQAEVAKVVVGEEVIAIGCLRDDAAFAIEDKDAGGSLVRSGHTEVTALSLRVKVDVCVLVVVVETVPTRVVIIGRGHSKTEEQNIDADAVRLMTDVIEDTREATLGTAKQDDVDCAYTIGAARCSRSSAPAMVGSLIISRRISPVEAPI
ncbi:uncharacterized protein BDZ83DRAFT_730536 [Colletotrichum acutatum]|uniref:Uncharacterized protein n=1 Tax=Glomerella acutata TaxID=27357 RepID=A0AAD8UL40_GLOAC|nr:uncharacterized protein BDZ83DRAFT_730536 [Colletotrichum acutatum]KAK1725298.1 hypothetical protein BDZ83DRAFT_730536 [Colletotrichum acutatum]